MCRALVGLRAELNAELRAELRAELLQNFCRAFAELLQSFCRALVEFRAELRAGLPLSFIPQGSRKAPQLYAEGWRRGRGHKRSALVFTERLGGTEVELGPLRR